MNHEIACIMKQETMTPPQNRETMVMTESTLFSFRAAQRRCVKHTSALGREGNNIRAI